MKPTKKDKKRWQAMYEPPGTTHIRKKVFENEDAIGNFNVVRVSLGEIDGVPSWLCLHSDGTYVIHDSNNPWNDDWELV